MSKNHWPFTTTFVTCQQQRDPIERVERVQFRRGRTQRPLLAWRSVRIEDRRSRKYSAVRIENSLAEKAPKLRHAFQPLAFGSVGNLHRCHLLGKVRGKNM